MERAIGLEVLLCAGWVGGVRRDRKVFLQISYHLAGTPFSVTSKDLQESSQSCAVLEYKITHNTQPREEGGVENVC